MTDAGTSARLPCGEIAVGFNVLIAESARVAVPSEATIREWIANPDRVAPRKVVIGDNTIVLDDVVVQEGTEIGADCYVDRAVHVGFDCHIADSCRLEYRAQICDRVSVGAGSVIGGFLCDGSVLGEECVVLGSLVHGVREPDLPWGQLEPDPVLEQRVFVGRGAVVVGGVRVGAGSYVAANATVTKDVPPDHVVINTNRLVPIDAWPGALRRQRWGAQESTSVLIGRSALGLLGADRNDGTNGLDGLDASDDEEYQQGGRQELEDRAPEGDHDQAEDQDGSEHGSSPIGVYPLRIMQLPHG